MNFADYTSSSLELGTDKCTLTSVTVNTMIVVVTIEMKMIMTHVTQAVDKLETDKCNPDFHHTVDSGGANEDDDDDDDCAGYTGSNCELETDECSPDPCVHGLCVDQHLNYSCHCHQGYTGSRYLLTCMGEGVVGGGG